jgi:hypothetical protein
MSATKMHINAGAAAFLAQFTEFMFLFACQRALPTGHVLNVSVKMGQFMLSGCAREVFKEFHLDRAITPRTPEPFFSFWAQH